MTSYTITVIIFCTAFLLLIVYAINKTVKRKNRYIVFANNDGIKTQNSTVYNWQNLTQIKYLNKYIIGKGTQTQNVAMWFYFTGGGIAEIDVRSNIYADVYNFCSRLQVNKTQVTTKGLVKQNN